jgi:hypothetical protein
MWHGQGHPSAPEISDHELTDLHQRLAGRYRHVDEHLLDGSIEDAILHHLAHPECFASDRGIPLQFYLEMWTRSYLSRRLRTEKRRQQHERTVGISGEIFEKIVSEMRAERSIYLQRDREELADQREALDAIVALLNPYDRAGVELLRAGASREEWIRHLGIGSLPQMEQQRKVNVEKDRLKKKLKRWAQKMQGGGARSQDRRQVRATCFDAGGERKSWLMQLRMSYTKRGDGTVGQKHSRASCSLVSAYCCS